MIEGVGDRRYESSQDTKYCLLYLGIEPLEQTSLSNITL